MGNLVFDDALLQHDGRAAAIGQMHQRILGAELFIDGHFLLRIVLRILQADLQLHATDATGGVDTVDGRLRAIDETIAQNLSQRAGQAGGLIDGDRLAIVGLGALLFAGHGGFLGGGRRFLGGLGRGRQVGGRRGDCGRAGFDGRLNGGGQVGGRGRDRGRAGFNRRFDRGA